MTLMVLGVQFAHGQEIGGLGEYEQKLEDQCNRGNAKSCMTAADYFYAKESWYASMDAYDKACKLHVSTGCRNDAIENDTTGHFPNEKDAAEEYNEACRLGDRESCARGDFVSAQLQQDLADQKEQQDRNIYRPATCPDGYYLSTLLSGKEVCSR